MRAIIVFALALLSLGVQVSAQDTECIKNAISTYGTGKVTTKADVAYVTVYVQGDGVLMTDAAQKSRQNTDQIVKSLNEKYRQIKEIKVDDVQVGQKNEEYFSDEKKDPRPEVIKRLRITLPPDPAVAEEIIDSAMRAGAVLTAPSSSFRYESDCAAVVVYGLVAASTYEDQAKKLAVDDARASAEKTAALVGKSVGDVVSIQCVSNSYWGAMSFANRNQDQPAKYIGLDPNKIDVSASLSISYELLKK